MKSPTLAPLALLISAPLSAPLWAQSPLFETAGPAGATGYGTRVTGLGDVNSDGRSDIAVADETGRVRVHSGADWSVLLDIAPMNPIVTGLGALDADGDGVKELVLAHQGHVGGSQFFIDLIDVSSGVSRWQYYDFQFIGEPEVRLVDAGDLDGDGLADLLVGVPDYDLWHPAWWESGFSALRGVDGWGLGQVTHNPEGMGEGLAVIGDLEGDQVPDVAVGSPLEGARRGKLRVYGWGPLHVLWERDGAFLGAELGEAVAAFGDVDGDGLSELAVLENGDLVGSGPERDLRVNVFAGSDGTLLYRREFSAAGHPGILFEVELEALEDLDGDGLGEIAMAVPRTAWGGAVLRILSGADLTTVQQWTDPDHTSITLPAAVLTDWDGDGVTDLIVGDPERGTTGWISVLPGELSVGTQSCDAAVPNSTGLAASLRLAGNGAADANDLLLLGFELPPNQWVLPLAAPEAGFVPDVGGGVGTLCVGGSIRRLLGSVDRADAAGGYWTRLDLDTWYTNPPAPIVAGETWYFQLWFRDPEAGTTSNLSDASQVTFD